MTALGAFSFAPAAMAGKPAPPPPPPPTTTATSYSGDAQVVGAHVEVLGLLNLLEANVSISKVGPLASTGGFDHTSLLQLGVNGPPLWLNANVASAKTAGAGDRSVSSASVADVQLGLGALTPSLLRVQASVLRSSATAKCGASGPELSGRSDIVKLRLAVGNALYADVLVTSAPNQVVDIAGIARITINEQIVTPGSITVNALHIQLNQSGLGSLLNPILNGDVVISHAHADIACQGGENPPPPPPCQVKDFVTGGGQIGTNDTSFGMVGGQKPNGLSGHFNLVDKRAGGPKLRGTDVTAYQVINATTRKITYTNDAGGTIVVTVTDNGEGAGAPADTISVTSGTYTVSGPVGGNIQLHTPKGCDTSTSTGGGKGGPKK
jgi:hypothetical protein